MQRMASWAKTLLRFTLRPPTTRRPCMFSCIRAHTLCANARIASMTFCVMWWLNFFLRGLVPAQKQSKHALSCARAIFSSWKLIFSWSISQESATCPIEAPSCMLIDFAKLMTHISSNSLVARSWIHEWIIVIVYDCFLALPIIQL